jgi:hypothetical protein
MNLVVSEMRCLCFMTQVGDIRRDVTFSFDSPFLDTAADVRASCSGSESLLREPWKPSSGSLVVSTIVFIAISIKKRTERVKRALTICWI